MWSLSGRTLEAVISETNGVLEIARTQALEKMRRSSEVDLLSSDRGGSEDFFSSGLLVDPWTVVPSQLCITGGDHASGNNRVGYFGSSLVLRTTRKAGLKIETFLKRHWKATKIWRICSTNISVFSLTQ